MNVAKAIEGIPVVASTAERDTLFPAPAMNQRVHNLATSSIEMWTGAWAPVFIFPTAEFNVKLAPYNAVGNGVSDDTVKVQAAIDACAAAGGGIVLFPKGTYLIKTSFLNVGSFVTLRGTGSQSILRAGTAQLVVVGATNQSFITVEKMALDGNALGSIGVQFTNCPNSAVRNCRITGFTQLQAGTAYGGGVHMYLSDDVTIEDNDMSGNGVLVGGLTSDIQINGNGVVADCTKRVKLHNNRLLSTAVQTNIAAYDVAYSAATENICSGAKTQASNNNGYGIMFYKTVNANAGTARKNRIEDNLVLNVDGTGIYVQSQNETAVLGNVIENAGKVQDDATLMVGAIAFSNSPQSSCTGNVIKDCGHTGIAIGGIAGNCYGHVVSANSIDTVTVGLAIGIKISGPIINSTINGNTIRNTASGIATPPTPISADGLTISGNTIETTTNNSGIELYGVSRTVVIGNKLLNTFRDGILVTVGTFCSIIGNEIWDGSVSVDNTYSAIDVASAPDTLVVGNIGGNSGGTGFKNFIFVNTTSPRSVVTGNKGAGARTANYNVDSTFANQVAFWGNFDPSAANPQIFPIRQQMVLQGSATSMVQLILGDSSSVGAVGTRWSGGDTYLAQNAVHIQGADTWHQPNAAAASKLLILRANGDVETYSAVLGTADGNFATFWGTVGASLSATGGVSRLKMAGTQVLTARSTGWTAMTGTATKAAAGFDTSTVTLPQLAQVVKALLDSSLSHGFNGA